MTDYEKAIMFNGIAVLTVNAALLIAFVAGAIFLPWWPAKVACVIGLIWYVSRTIASYYVSR